MSYEPGQVIVGNGVKHVIYNALRASLNAGDKVIIPSPYWVSYPSMVSMCGGHPIFLGTRMAHGFKIQADDLRAAITPDTKWLFLNSPSNPSGAVYSPTELQALTDVLMDHPHVWVLTDDVYEHLVYSGLEYVTPAQVEPALYDRTLTLNGVSKAHAMTGWRVGYAAGPKRLIDAMVLLQSQQTSGTCTVSQWAAVEALDGPQEHLKTFQKTFEERCHLTVAMLRQCQYLYCPIPEGAFYVFPSCREVIGKKSRAGTFIKSDEDFVQALLEEENVATVQGSAFGEKGYFRMSYAASNSDIIEGCERIKRFCENLN